VRASRKVLWSGGDAAAVAVAVAVILSSIIRASGCQLVAHLDRGNRLAVAHQNAARTLRSTSERFARNYE
jgi:hypothetical protein